jgi:hypothetical protein
MGGRHPRCENHRGVTLGTGRATASEKAARQIEIGLSFK